GQTLRPDSKERNNESSEHLPGTSVRALLSSCCIGGSGVLFTASGAKADCGFSYKTGTAPSIPFLKAQAEASLNHQEDEKSNKDTSIVRMWHLIYTATSASGPFPPTPFQFLESFKTWHADGTEFENAFLP